LALGDLNKCDSSFFLNQIIHIEQLAETKQRAMLSILSQKGPLVFQPYKAHLLKKAIDPNRVEGIFSQS
jgi:hypothetical protein